MLWLSIFTRLTLRDSSCIFITRPDLIFKTLVRHSTQVQLSRKLLTVKNKDVCYWLETRRRKTRAGVIMSRNTPGMSDKAWCELIQHAPNVFFIHLMWILCAASCKINAWCNPSAFMAAIMHLYASLRVYSVYAGLHASACLVICTFMSHPTLTFILSIWRLLWDSQPEGRVRATEYGIIRRFPRHNVSAQYAT